MLKVTHKLDKISPLIYFIIIVLLSSIFRTTNLELIEFKTDEAINLFLATRPVFGHPFPPGGCASSFGILNPPLLNYLLFPLVLISTDPKIIVFFIGLLNSLAIGFLYLIFRKYYSQKLALITTLLMAFSPWLIIYSRKIWQQDFIIILMVPFLYSLHKIIFEKKMSFWALLSLSSFLLIQIHQVNIIFVLLVYLFLIRERVYFDIKYFLIGFILGLLPIVPYLFFQYQNKFPDFYTLINFKERISTTNSLSFFLRPMQILGQGNFQSLMRDDMLTFSNNFPIVFQLRKAFYFEYLLLPIGIFMFWKDYKKTRFLICATLCIPIIYFIFRFEPLMHYFIIISPLLFLFAGYAFTELIKSKIIILRVFFLLILLIIIFTSIFFNLSFFGLVNKNNGLNGDYAVAFKVLEKQAKIALKKYEDKKNYNEIVINYYVPPDSFLEYKPLSKVVFGKEVAKRNISNSENILTADPDNPIALNELVSYYSIYDPNRELLNKLNNKRIKNTGYETIYQLVYSLYLHKEFKRRYNYGVFFFEYPEHWIVKKDKDRLTVETDQYRLLLTTSLIQESSNADASTCILLEKNWCGIKYKTINIKDDFFQAIYEVKISPGRLLNLNDNNLLGAIRTMDNIVNSISNDN